MGRQKQKQVGMTMGPGTKEQRKQKEWKTTTTKNSLPYDTELKTPTISSAKRKKIVVWSAMYQNKVYTMVTKSITKG